MRTDLRARVFDLLKELRGTNPLKQLFWQELNYRKVNQPLPRRDWTQDAAQALADDPVLFAQADGFHILYCQLAADDKLRLTDERLVVNRLLREHPYSLFVFSDRKQERWHLVNVREGAKEDQTAARKVRRLLRRIAIGPEERLRTASERIAKLDLASIAPTLYGVSPLEVQKRYDEAFNVEAVTDKFFEEYRLVFYQLQEQLAEQTKNDRQWAHDYALQFLNRLMFLYFIQRKRWLGDDTEFIRTFWDAYKGSRQARDSFFSNWLEVLFFEAFNNQYQAGRSDRRHFPPEIQNALAKAPFLNGGLFTRNDLDEKHTFNVPDSFFDMLFERFQADTPGFLERYNFTIREDSPFDQEVAVDPEMIGKVYEKRADQLSLFEELEEEPADLNEIEQLLRQLRRDKPSEFERIANLRDGIRSGLSSTTKGIYAFFRAGRYQQLVIVDTGGKAISKELSDALRVIACGPGESAHELPRNYNRILMQAKNEFDTLLKHRRAEREHSVSLTQGQRYVLRELRVLYNSAQDEEARRDIAALEQAFRSPLTVAISRELNALRRHAAVGGMLLNELKRIYFHHDMRNLPSRLRIASEEDLPRIVCSEALL